MTKDDRSGKPARRARKPSELPEWSGRSMTGRTLDAILPRITRTALQKHPAAAVRLILDWPEIVGPRLGRETQPRRLSAGTLTIACSGPVAMELQHLAPQMIERINAHCGPLRQGRDLRFDQGPQLVKRLRIVQDATVLNDSAPTPAARPVPQGVDIPDMEDGPLRDVLSRIGGHLGRRKSGRRS